LVPSKCKFAIQALNQLIIFSRDTDNGIGREIVSRFTINDFDNADTFYTDANGRELLKRQLNKRYDYEYDSTLEPIASNYYPITSKIVLKDENKNLEVALLNDRAQGGSSLQSGQVEIMVTFLSETFSTY
jgi:lysosomal alpha-mannosidase